MEHTLDLVNYLVDLLTVKEHLGVESSDTSSDSSLVILINGVSKWFKNKCGRQLRQADITEYRDGNSLDEIYTDTWPITSESLHVYIDTTHEFGADTEIDSASMIVDEETGRITLMEDIFTRGRKSVKLTYPGGYSSIPYDLQLAALMMIDKVKNPQAAGMSSVSIAGGSVAYFDSIAPKFVLDVIERYSER